MIIKGALRVVVILFLAFTLKAFTANAQDLACIPKDHTPMVETGIGNVMDNLVAVITNQIFGPIKGMNQLNIFAANNLDYGNRVWEDGMVYRIFMSIITDGRFQVIFYLSVTLLCAFLGASFALGYSQYSTSMLVTQFVKIAIVVFFLTPAGWETYLELIVKNVIVAARYFNKAIMASMYNVPYSSVTSPFVPIDMVIGILISGATWSKIGALFWANGFMFTALLLVVLAYVVLTLLIILMKTTVLYATLLIMSSVLLAIGPIFAICILFEKTKEYFMKWVSNLIGLFMQQYILFLGFFLFCMMISAMLKGIFFFETCWGYAMGIHLMVAMPQFIIGLFDSIVGIVNSIVGIFGKKIAFKLPEWIIDHKIPFLSAYVLNAEFTKIPSNIFSLAGVAALTALLSKFTDSVSKLGGEIAGSDLSATDIAKPMTDSLTKLQSHVDSGAKAAAISAGTGKMALSGSRLMHSAKDAIDQRLAARIANGQTTGFATRLMQAGSAALTPGAALSKYGIHTTAEKNAILAIGQNQRMAREFQDKLVKDMIASGAHKDTTEITDPEKEEMRKKTIEHLKENGYNQAGVKGAGASEAFAERSMTSKVSQKNALSLVTNKLDVNLGAPMTLQDERSSAVKSVTNAIRATFVDKVTLGGTAAGVGRNVIKKPLAAAFDKVFGVDPKKSKKDGGGKTDADAKKLESAPDAPSPSPDTEKKIPGPESITPPAPSSNPVPDTDTTTPSPAETPAPTATPDTAPSDVVSPSPETPSAGVPKKGDKIKPKT